MGNAGEDSTKDNKKLIKEVSLQLNKFALEQGLIDLSHLMIDGTTLKANTNNNRIVDKKTLEKLSKYIDKVIEEGIKVDEEEDKFPAAADFDLREVSADKAYSSRHNLDAVANLGAIPYIPFKKNAIMRSKGFPIWRDRLNYFMNNRERFLQSYHKRSNVETAFHMVKRKFGNNLQTKKDVSQVNKILMKCLGHNLSVLIQESYELDLNIDLKECTDAFFLETYD